VLQGHVSDLLTIPRNYRRPEPEHRLRTLSDNAFQGRAQITFVVNR